TGETLLAECQAQERVGRQRRVGVLGRKGRQQFDGATELFLQAPGGEGVVGSGGRQANQAVGDQVGHVRQLAPAFRRGNGLQHFASLIKVSFAIAGTG